MGLTAVILLIILGILLLLLEVLVIPGVGVVGFVGFVLMMAGIYFAYHIDNMTGHLSLTGSLLASVGLIWLAMRSKTWDRVALSKELDGKSPVASDTDIAVGDTGIAISRIAPMGTARINGKLVEVSSRGDFIDESTHVAVARIEGVKIIVTTQN